MEDFTRQSKLTEPDAERIGTLRRQYFLDLLTDLFDFSGIERPLRKYIRTAEEHLHKLYPKQIAGYREALEHFTAEVTEVALKFRPQYTRMVESSPDGYASCTVLQERIRSGAGYFREKLEALGEIFNPSSRLNSDKQSPPPDRPSGIYRRHRLRDRRLPPQEGPAVNRRARACT